MSRVSLTVLLVVMVAGLPRPGRAQDSPVPPQILVVLARNDLKFGRVLPGIPNHVPTSSHDRAGLFEIRGEDHTSVRIDFMLPAALVSGTRQLPLSFGPGDGEATNDDSLPWSPFDPRAPLVTTLGGDGQLWVRLGGTALPGQNQPGGEYHATITLTVSQLGS